MSTLSVVHRLSIPAPSTHLVEVETTLTAKAGGLPAELVLFMPVWSPGSYLVREYARHVEGLTAAAPARAIKVRKNAWRIDTGGASSAVVRYRVYANELTVRTSHVDDTHAFLVGAALFVAAEGELGAPTRVEIRAPEGWKTSTALREASGGLEAPDYDTLVDSPIEIGTHREERFSVLGVPHRYSHLAGGRRPRVARRWPGGRHAQDPRARGARCSTAASRTSRTSCCCTSRRDRGAGWSIARAPRSSPCLRASPRATGTSIYFRSSPMRSFTHGT